MKVVITAETTSLFVMQGRNAMYSCLPRACWDSTNTFFSENT
jgi:hypothetical protein